MELRWPLEWVVFGPVTAKSVAQAGEDRSLPDVPEMATLVSREQMQGIPDRLTIGGRTFEGERLIAPSGIAVDLEQVFGETPRGAAAYLFASVTAEQEMDIEIGSGADWFMKWWLDGEPLYDTLTTGNREFPIAVTNHAFEAHLSPGEHVLTVCVVRGSNSFVFAAGDLGRLRAEAGSANTAAVRRAAYALLASNPHAEDQHRARGHLELGKLYMEDQECEAAREAYGEVLQMDARASDKARARLGLGRVAMYQRDPDAASQTFRSVLEDLEASDEVDGPETEQARARLKTANMLTRMRKSHPRMFFNSDTWPAVAARAQGAEKERLAAWKQTLQDRLSEPLERADLGPLAMRAAFVYRMTGDQALLDKIETLLRLSLEQYEYAAEQTKDAETFHSTASYGVSYEPYTRINWVLALDWVWDDLPPEVRQELASRMVDFVYAVMRRWGSTTSGGGFYKAANLFWYAGLGLWNDELDDLHYRRALAVLEHGWRDYQQLMEYRRRGRGDFGQYGIRLAYTLHHYPYAEWHFLHTWQSAVDEQILGPWQHSALFANGLLWNRLPGFHAFGFDIGWHWTNQLSPWQIYAHVSEHMHFYGESHPQLAAMSHYMREELEALGTDRGHWHLEICPFVLTNLDKVPRPALPESLPTARYAPTLGIVYMYSGFGDEDTYAAFRLVGGKQYDSTHFVIYKQGFLALDAGARMAGEHSDAYWGQTVAHNCVLIRMPGETFPAVWGTTPAPGNAGGQRRRGRGGLEHIAPRDYDPRTGPARVVAFETNADYTYAGGDATGTYHEDKCAEMVRQFVYLPPDHFVVFDRVTSTKAEYPKRWILHTANEPQVADAVWHADQGEGRLFCQTLYPRDAVPEKVGGPGKEFWVDGKNYAIADDWKYWSNVPGHKPGEVPDTMGRWRMEVKPGEARTQDWFLHVLQASSQDVESMVQSELLERDDQLGVTFTRGGRTYTVTFNRSGEVGGHIRIEEGGTVLIDRPLTQEIMQQHGLALTE